MMKKLIVLAATGLLSLGFASAPASAQSAGHILRGAGIGAAGGAVAGAVIPGLSVGQGALIGGAGGAIYNTIDKGNHRSYRKNRKYSRNYNHNRRYRR
jgi:phage tail tape-measure protein